jgi:hypothetical protein
LVIGAANPGTVPLEELCLKVLAVVCAEKAVVLVGAVGAFPSIVAVAIAVVVAMVAAGVVTDADVTFDDRRGAISADRGSPVATPATSRTPLVGGALVIAPTVLGAGAAASIATVLVADVATESGAGTAKADTSVAGTATAVRGGSLLDTGSVAAGIDASVPTDAASTEMGAAAAMTVAAGATSAVFRAEVVISGPNAAGSTDADAAAAGMAATSALGR